jgi:EmrB/QacA subfamily drug resistance transporter
MLIISRSAQGVGGAIVFATSLALLGNSFRGRDRGVAFGIWGAIVGVSTALGPVLGGLITTDWDWRGIFLVNVPVGVVALIVTIWKVEESRSPHPGRPDWIGFLLLTAGLVSFIYGLIRAGEQSWTDHRALACLAGGTAAIIAFVIAEALVRNPMFDLKLLRVPTFTGGSIAAFAMNGSLFSVLLYQVIYLQDILGYSALGAGLRLSIISLGQLVTAIIAGRISSRVPVRWLIGPGLFIVGVGLVLTGRINGDSTWTHLIPGFIVSGLGAGMVNPPLASTAIGVVPPHQSGMASGINSTFRQIGIATGIAALGSIFTSEMQSHLASTLPTSMSGSAASIVNAVRQGSAGRLIASAPPAERGVVGAALRSSFATGLNDLLYVTAGLAVFGAVCATILIRGKDFHQPGGEPGAGVARDGEPAEVLVPADEVRGGEVAAAPPPAPLAAADGAVTSGTGASGTGANGAGIDGLAVFGRVRHGEGMPLPGATVTLVDPAGRQTGIGHSGPDGRYQVPVPERGTYTLIAMAGSHEPYASAVRVAGQPAEVDMLLSGASKLSGVVRAAGTGEPLPGVTLALADGRGEVVGTAVTGDAGEYAVENLVAGQYTLAVSAPSYQPIARPVTITDGQPTTLDPELRTGARLEGTARNTVGDLVRDVRVTLLDPDGNVAGVATTGPDGAYCVENLPEGEYAVIATGYPPVASRLKVVGTSTHSHDVELGHPRA